MFKKIPAFLLASSLFHAFAFQAPADSLNKQTLFESESPRFAPLTNERLVAGALRTIVGAEYTYQATVGAGDFGLFPDLGQSQLIDAVLASGEKYGYRFTLVRVQRTATEPARFSVQAAPIRYRKNGRWSFYTDETGVLRGADRNGQPADTNDPPLDFPAKDRTKN